MAKTGMQRNKAHKQHMEQEALITEMADAMRDADLPHVAAYGRVTPRMAVAWYRYVEFAVKVANA